MFYLIGGIAVLITFIVLGVLSAAEENDQDRQVALRLRNMERWAMAEKVARGALWGEDPSVAQIQAAHEALYPEASLYVERPELTEAPAG